MDNATSNRLSAIDATLNFLGNNSAQTAVLPGFAAVKAVVDGKRAEISDNNQIALRSTEGVTENTNKIRFSMCEKAAKCANALKAYASIIGDDTLLDKVDCTEMGLKRMDKDAVAELCQTIHDEANTHIADAVNYGITADDVTGLQTAIDLYADHAQDPRDAQVARKQAIANVKTLVKEVREIFKLQIDPMIETLRETQSSFVAQYFMNREIVNLGIIPTQVRGTVRNNNQTPLKGVTLTAVNSTTGVEAGTIKTEQGGKYRLRLVPGNYDLAWTLPGYQAVNELNVKFIQGKMVTRKVVLQAA